MTTFKPHFSSPDSPDFMPETQVKQPRPTKKKGKKTKTTQNERVAWKKEEEVSLA